MNVNPGLLPLLLSALKFASEKHVFHRRKGHNDIPYINHLIYVTHILTKHNETDPDLLIAALLHDTLEDTDTLPAEIEQLFGKNVLDIVQEVTDDMSLTYEERKRLQIKKAPILSQSAKKIKIADKLCNISDIERYPLHWSARRKKTYIEWSNKVIQGCTPVNTTLEEEYMEVAFRVMNSIEGID
jgi:(p)ppGpp synthase/HD superfamily hydrolase